MTATKKIKVAIAGAGMVTRYHLNAWARFSRVELERDQPFETDRLDNLETQRLVSEAYRLAGL